MTALTDEQQMLAQSLSDLAENEFEDRAFEWGGNPPWENVELLADRGFLGINIDEAYGGGGMSEFEAMLTIEIVGRVCPDTAEFLYNQQMVAPRAIEMFGSETAKGEYLPPVTAGEEAIAIAISEPESGSDVGSMHTSAEDDGDAVAVNGEKTWVSNVKHASAAVTWVKFPEGLGSVIIDLNSAGVEVQQHYTNMAGHEQTHFYLEDVTVPPENVLTRGKEGFKNQLKALNWERLGSATLANTIARCALETALDYVEQREQFGQPIGNYQGIEWKLADMVTELEASRALTYRAAERAYHQNRIPNRLDASIAKLYSGQMVESVASEALQLHGANGYQRDHPLEYLYRLARGRRIAAGTDEIQKNTISSVVKDKGLPSLL
ncbi:acyl-CoA dehydrogenase family protein [Natrinema gelatinilyticum]|uniref:acyl-CoA dehydrogenase family protein n=1 Tax=Natrinema gelatinilyticum TaxID=2961571 RepID=UPI0020C2D072|nr:acyl-CoA dehydrogenase family protein [Natrinema gelatinilyticum]